MHETRTSDILSQLRRRNPRYARPAYLFIMAALHRCLERLETPRHVSGAELAGAVRELALERFGPLARTVLEHWGIHSTGDMGELVFLLVESGVLIKQPGDTREDFEEIYSFHDAFESGYPFGALDGQRSA